MASVRVEMCSRSSAGSSSSRACGGACRCALRNIRREQRPRIICGDIPVASGSSGSCSSCARAYSGARAPPSPCSGARASPAGRRARRTASAAAAPGTAWARRSAARRGPCRRTRSPRARSACVVGRRGWAGSRGGAGWLRETTCACVCVCVCVYVRIDGWMMEWSEREGLVWAFGDASD